jgi:hypothetical protein
MPWSPFKPKRLSDQHTPGRRRGTERLPPSDLRAVGHSGAHRDESAACYDALGLRLIALHALVALVARHRAGYETTTRGTLDELFRSEHGFSVGNVLPELERMRLVRDLGRIGGASAWQVTAEGIRRVVAWAGLDEGSAAAE